METGGPTWNLADAEWMEKAGGAETFKGIRPGANMGKHDIFADPKFSAEISQAKMQERDWRLI